MKKMQINDFLSEEVVPSTAYMYTSNQDNCIPSALLTKPMKKRPLVITFTAVIHRDKYELPAFVGQFLLTGDPLDATILAFSDPSLELSPDMVVGWFAGNAQQDIPGDIKRIVEIFVEKLEPSRLIFLGGSAAAYTAAAISHAFKNSLAIVVNPIFNLEPALDKSHEAHFAIENYMKWCWPDLNDPKELVKVILVNTTKFYEDGYENMVLILGNATDYGPIQKQYMDFYMRVPNTENILFISTFFPETLGHHYPRHDWGRWVRAAVEALQFDLTSIASQATFSAQRSNISSEDGWSNTDIDLADKLADFRLGEDDEY